MGRHKPNLKIELARKLGLAQPRCSASEQILNTLDEVPTAPNTRTHNGTKVPA